MRALLSTAGLARASARRPWWIVAGWIVLLVVSAGAATLASGHLTTDSNFLNRPESKRAYELLGRRFDGPRAAGETVIVQSSTLTVDDPAFEAKVRQVVGDLARLPMVIADPRRTFSYYDAKAAGSPLAKQMISRDRHATVIPVALAEDDDAFLRAVKKEGTSEFQVLSVGKIAINHQFDSLSQSDLKKEIVGLPVAMIVLIVVFGALVAAGVPIVLAIAAIVVAFGLTGTISRTTELSVYVANMITVIGMAVGIDYGLFIIERYREERRRGVPQQEAIVVAGGTASKAVLFSGMTVVLALSGMLLIPTTIFRSLGLGAILVTIAAVGAMLTLVPALLSLLGDRIDWPRRRRYDAQTAAAQRARDEETFHTGFWGRVTRVVMGQPVVSLVLAATLLVAAALPYFDLKTGTAGVECLPDSDLKSAFEILRQKFYAGVLSPVQIVVDGPQTPEVQAAIDRLLTDLGKDPAFGPVLDQRYWNGAGDLADIRVPLKGDPNDPASYAVVKRLRATVIPAAFAGVPAAVLVTGDTAEKVDFNAVVDTWTPRVFAFVLGLSFLLLLLAFRSLVVPAKAIVMNLLSVGAAYGLMVLVFQKGYLHRLFHFRQTPVIEAWIPIFLFCVLFGLSMDYHVFLLSRVREQYDRTRRNGESVASGLQATARIITGAALIMVVVFGAFASGQLVMFQQVGFGLAIAILLDATVVRSILVPSAMALLGDANWYLPRWLAWLPDLRVEGAAHLPSPAAASEAVAD